MSHNLCTQRIISELKIGRINVAWRVNTLHSGDGCRAPDREIQDLVGSGGTILGLGRFIVLTAKFVESQE